MRIPKFLSFYDQPGDGGGGGAPPAGAPAPSSAPASAPSGSPAGGAPGGQPGSAGAPGGAPPPSQFSYAEDRSRWIPPHRLQETNQRYSQLEGRYQDIERRYRALAGLEQPRNEQHDQLRAQFSQVFPELAPVLQDPRALGELLELARSGQLREMRGTTEAYWGRHAQQTSRSLVEAYAKSVGVEPSTLPPRAHQRMALQLKSFIEEDQTGDRQYRFEMGDPKLVEDCLADMQGLFVEPVRRSTATAAARVVETNRRLPDNGPRGQVPPGGPPAARSRKETSAAARQFVLDNR